MERIREEILEIAGRMANEEVQGLCDLRKKIVDLDLPEEASKVDDALFLALYLGKRLTGDVWENLATDASFDFDEDQLKTFVISSGEALQSILSNDTGDHIIINKLGELTRCLYGYFYNFPKPWPCKEGEKR